MARRVGGVGSLDESYAQALLSGRPFVMIDNLRGRLDSQLLEMALTAGGHIPCRTPGRAEIMVDVRHVFHLLTSNGVETTADFANRSSIIRLRKRPRHSFRQFDEGDLLSHVAANQNYYLACVFSVIGQWKAHGKQSTGDTRHDFREWARTLDWIVQKIFGLAPLLDGHEAAQRRVSNPAITWLRLVALAVESAGRLGEDLTASAIAELCEEHELEILGSRPGADDQGSGRRLVAQWRAFSAIARRSRLTGFASSAPHAQRLVKEAATILPSTIDSSCMNREVRTGPHKAHKDYTRSGNHLVFQEPTTPCAPCAVHPLMRTPVIERARRYMANFPPAVSGQKGHNRTFQAACILIHRFGLNHSSALTLLKEWNDSCTPPWNERDLARKISEAEKAQRARTSGKLRANRPTSSVVVRRIKKQPLEMVNHLGEQPSMNGDAEARRVAAELVKLHRDRAISGADDPEARFYAGLLHAFGATYTGCNHRRCAEVSLRRGKLTNSLLSPRRS